MALSFHIVSQHQDTELVGGSVIRDVMTVGATTIPHGVYFEVRVPMKNYGTQAVTIACEGRAEVIEAIMAVEGVIAVSYSQDVNAAGQLHDDYAVIVESTSGQSSTEVHPSTGFLDAGIIQAQVAAAVANLDAVEGL